MELIDGGDDRNRPLESAARAVFDGSRAPVAVTMDGAPLQVQMCLSPHCTTLASLLESTNPGWWSGPPEGWRRIVAERSEAVDMTALAPYTAEDRFPVFLTAALTTPAPAFADQVAEIRSVSSERMTAEIHDTFPEGIPETFTPFLDHPREAIDRLTQALLAYWDKVVGPSWPTIRPFLEREILAQGYALATRGSADALSDVHPAMRFRDGTLLIDSDVVSGSGSLTGRGLMLTPLISDRAGILADLKNPTHVKIGYAAPGAQEIWMRPLPADSTRSRELESLLGVGRARVVRALRNRETTTTLSVSLKLAPATISGHLTALDRLSLVDRMRVGRSVHYRLSERGQALLALFEADASEAAYSEG